MHHARKKSHKSTSSDPTVTTIAKTHHFTYHFLMAHVFSAPGKALLAGGYLVIDPQYEAYVTALSSRMHAHVQLVESSDCRIYISSPQFGGEWEYTVKLSDDAPAFAETQGRKNPFLEATVKTVLNYLLPSDRFDVKITLFSDPGYHTTEGTSAKSSLNGRKSFLFHQKPIDQVPKTGMGSSAGLVSVVTAALFSHFLKQPLNYTRNTVHNLAQIAHCEAQKKIGSGFDVAAAVYGSIIYRRFKPEVFNHLLGRDLDRQLCSELREAVDSNWSFTHTHCSLPKGIKLVMGDVSAGSETPKLVSKVLAWKQLDPESAIWYEHLNQGNKAFVRSLEQLHNLSETNRDYDTLLADPATLELLRRAIAQIRRGFQEVTKHSGAEIEPPEQTELLDKCNSLPGCVGGLVPGAGGYDAISVLVLEKEMEAFQKASEEDEYFSRVSWLDLSEESAGLLEEDPRNYSGLV